MAGHSKWANIQHRKNRQDDKRGKLFTRLIREVEISARMGGVDLTSNPRLRLALDKASEANIPKDTLNRAIQRGSGALAGVHYDSIRYEGYGIKGAAVIVDCLTDNRTRTVAEVRHAFSKHGGNLGTDGCVSYLFRHCGQFLFAPGVPEEKLVNAAIETGAENIHTDSEGGIEITCEPALFLEVQDNLSQAGFRADVAEIVMRPDTEVVLLGDDARNMQKLLNVLENLDDVQQVYSNTVFDETTFS